MCINLRWSLGAAVIGLSSGYIMYRKGEPLGLFVAYFTSMQIVEAMAHSRRFDPKLVSRLGNISINGQGIALAVSLVLADKIPVWGIVPFVIEFVAAWDLLYDFQVQPGKDNGIRWYTIGPQKEYMQYMMYAAMIGLGCAYKPKLTLLFIVTLLWTYSTRPKTHAPGLWCLASAVASPLLVLIVTLRDKPKL